MCEPKFKIGDKVRACHKLGLIIDGPFRPLRYVDGKRWASLETQACYLVHPEGGEGMRSAEGFLAAEPVIEFAERWEPCLGKHRMADIPFGELTGRVERRID